MPTKKVVWVSDITPGEFPSEEAAARAENVALLAKEITDLDGVGSRLELYDAAALADWILAEFVRKSHPGPQKAYPPKDHSQHATKPYAGVTHHASCEIPQPVNPQPPHPGTPLANGYRPPSARDEEWNP